jgi:hypothetical protein
MVAEIKWFKSPTAEINKHAGYVIIHRQHKYAYIHSTEKMKLRKIEAAYS